MSDDFDDLILPEPPLAGGLGQEAATFDQADIDALLGFDTAPVTTPKTGLKAVIESNVISHERLPMLEVICERMVRAFATSMRNLTTDPVDVSLEEIRPARFGEFMNHVALPAMFGVFKVQQWDNYGVVVVDSSLIYSVVDALLGGRKGQSNMRIEGRAFTSIETMLVQNVVQLALSEFSAAFEAIEPVTMEIERMESSPRFAAIAGPTNITAVASFRVDMEGRGGVLHILLPYATIEPVRDKLLQRFMGEKLGRDMIWEAHMAAELLQTSVTVDVVLGERQMRMQEVVALKVGQTIPLNRCPDDALELHCGGVPLGLAHIGQRRNTIAVCLASDISKGFSR